MSNISINSSVLLKILEEIKAIGSSNPKAGMEKLNQIIAYLKEKTQ